jgi:methionine synthase II (cobalamin-independent)
MRTVAGALPEFPHLPELPKRGPGADMIGRAAALLVDIPVEVTPRGWRIAERAGRDVRRARSYLSADLDAVEEVLDGYEGPLKIQVAGPWTLAATLEQPKSLEASLRDPGLVADLAASLAEGLSLHVAEVAKRVPGAALVVQVDEPALPSVIDGAVPTASGFGRLRVPDEEIVRDRLGQVMAAASGYGMVHCCGHGYPFGIITAVGARALSLDTSQLRTADFDELAAAAEAGLGLFLGFAERIGDTPKRIADSVAEIWRRMGQPPARCAEQVVITPACGLAGSSPQQARDTLKLVREAARILPELMEELS